MGIDYGNGLPCPKTIFSYIKMNANTKPSMVEIVLNFWIFLLRKELLLSQKTIKSFFCIRSSQNLKSLYYGIPFYLSMQPLAEIVSDANFIKP